MRLAVVLALLPAAAWAAGPSKLEKACRDRYDNGTPKEISKACGNCLEREPKNTACRQAIQFLNSRPKLSPTDYTGQPMTEAMRQSQQHYLSGMIYFQKQDYEKARDEWQVAKNLDPNNSDAQMGLERLDKLYGINQQQASLAPTKSVDHGIGEGGSWKGPDRPGVPAADRTASQQRYLSGMVYFQKGDYEKARDEWQLAKKLDPHNADAQAGLERIEKLYGSSQK